MQPLFFLVYLFLGITVAQPLEPNGVVRRQLLLNCPGDGSACATFCVSIKQPDNVLHAFTNTLRGIRRCLV
jgi:hypothetical protein